MEKQKLLTVTIKDCEVQTFCSGGPGGQNQNKRQTGVRIIHKASGARGEAREQKSQGLNKRAAFRRMAETKEFKLWLKIEASRMAGKPTVEELVDQTLVERNLRVECKDGSGQWVELAEDPTIE